jgi:hypothetical protein
VPKSVLRRKRHPPPATLILFMAFAWLLVRQVLLLTLAPIRQYTIAPCCVNKATSTPTKLLSLLGAVNQIRFSLSHRKWRKTERMCARNLHLTANLHVCDLFRGDCQKTLVKFRSLYALPRFMACCVAHHYAASGGAFKREFIAC